MSFSLLQAFLLWFFGLLTGALHAVNYCQRKHRDR